MEKYAGFIWGAYGLTALVFIALIAGALSHARRWKQKAEAQGRK